MAAILSSHQIILPCDDNIPFDPEESADSFFGNALIKAEALYRLTGKPALADDSGICVDALGGEPGIYSARYGSTPLRQLTDSERNALLLNNMSAINNRDCRFVCCMVLFLGPHQFYAVQETLEGQLVHEERGNGGFGYDPLVYVEKYGKTVAELSAQEKNRISHRAKAAQAMARLLEAVTVQP